MSTRQKLLEELGKNGIRTRDELREALQVEETKIRYALNDAAKLKLVDRVIECGVAAYQITSLGRQRLKDGVSDIDPPSAPEVKPASARYRNIDFNGGLINDQDYFNEQDARDAAGSYALKNNIGVDVCQVVATARVEMVPSLNWSSAE